MSIVYVENGKAISYHGITIYHVYKNDFEEQGPREYWFTLNPFGSEDGEDSFDVRDLEGYTSEKTPSANLVQMIDAGLFGETNILQRESTGAEDAYDAVNSNPGQCPVCNVMLENYGSYEIHDDQIKYPFNCSNCGVQGSEWRKLNFDGYTVP